jgi:membrane-bound serine protease (ClpP class)
MLELLLFGTGVLLLAVEIFVLPGFGVAGISGVILIVLSLVLACQGFIVPQSDHDWKVLLSSILLVFGSGAVFTVVAAVMTRYLDTIPLLKGMILKPPGYDQAAGTDEGISLAVEPQKDGKTGGLSVEPAVQIGSLGLTVRQPKQAF